MPAFPRLPATPGHLPRREPRTASSPSARRGQLSILWAALLAVSAPPMLGAPARAQTARTSITAYERECAACHIAYPPSMLEGAAWKRLLDNLSRHFGTDASLDAATVGELDAWLAVRAAREASARPAAGEPRISRTPWFLHEHGELGAAVWRRPAVRSASNCGACHAGAARGDFDEDGARVPR